MCLPHSHISLMTFKNLNNTSHVRVIGVHHNINGVFSFGIMSLKKSTLNLTSTMRRCWYVSNSVRQYMGILMFCYILHGILCNNIILYCYNTIRYCSVCSNVSPRNIMYLSVPVAWNSVAIVCCYLLYLFYVYYVNIDQAVDFLVWFFFLHFVIWSCPL